MCFQGKDDPARNFRRLVHFSLCLFSASLAGCFKDIEAPPCETLAQCPATPMFYNVCEENYCFFSDACKHSPPLPEDMCCPDFEGDRTNDSDCVSDVFLQGGVSTPAMLGSKIVVSANVLKNDKALVVLYLLDSKLKVHERLEVGRCSMCDRLLPVVVSNSGLVYVAHSQGVKAFAYAEENRLEMKRDISGDAPQGNLVALSPSKVLWPVSVNGVVIYDEVSGEKKVVEAVEPSRPGDTVQSLVANNFYGIMVTSLGDARILELEAPRFYALQDISHILFALPFERTLYAFSADGTVSAIELTSGRKRWDVALDGEVMSNPILDRFGNIFVATRQGIYKVVDKGMDVEKSKTILDQLSAPSFLFITDKTRLMLVSQDKIVSFITQGKDSFVKGLWFSTSFQVNTAPAVFLNRIWVPSRSGHLFVFLFGESLEQGGFCAPFGGTMNSSFVASKGN